MPDQGWVRIYSSNQPHQAGIAKAILAENGIQSVTIDKKDSAYIFGDVELYVSPANADKALLILTENDLI